MFSVPGYCYGGPENERLSLGTNFEQLLAFCLDEGYVLGVFWMFLARMVDVPLEVDHTNSKRVLPHPISNDPQICCHTHRAIHHP